MNLKFAALGKFLLKIMTSFYENIRSRKTKRLTEVVAFALALRLTTISLDIISVALHDQ